MPSNDRVTNPNICPRISQHIILLTVAVRSNVFVCRAYAGLKQSTTLEIDSSVTGCGRDLANLGPVFCTNWDRMRTGWTSAWFLVLLVLNIHSLHASSVTLRAGAQDASRLQASLIICAAATSLLSLTTIVVDQTARTNHSGFPHRPAHASANTNSSARWTTERSRNPEQCPVLGNSERYDPPAQYCSRFAGSAALNHRSVRLMHCNVRTGTADGAKAGLQLVLAAEAKETQAVISLQTALQKHLDALGEIQLLETQYTTMPSAILAVIKTKERIIELTKVLSTNLKDLATARSRVETEADASKNEFDRYASKVSG